MLPFCSPVKAVWISVNGSTSPCRWSLYVFPLLLAHRFCFQAQHFRVQWPSCPGRAHSFSAAGVSGTCSFSYGQAFVCAKASEEEVGLPKSTASPDWGVFDPYLCNPVLMAQAFTPTGSISLQDSPDTDPSPDLSISPRLYKSPRTAVKVQLLF